MIDFVCCRVQVPSLITCQCAADREEIKIPMIANGNILYFEDVDACIAATGVDGVMSAETLLTNPALFSGKYLPVWDIATRYLEISKV
jgi:tRNA-dihydrouridine synthase 1